MSDRGALVTSPFVFIHPQQEEACAWVMGPGMRQHRYRRLSLAALRMLCFFLIPRTPSEAADADIDEAQIAEALVSSLLVPVDDPAYETMSLWEDRRWSRAAYLLFSQLDLNYLEPIERTMALASLSAERRQTIRSYLAERPYPARFLVDDPSPRNLPAPGAGCDSFDLDALVGRRSSRSFAKHAIKLRQLTDTLYHASANVRLATESQAGGDPYYLLNSFYSWLEIYVAVQGVLGVGRGLFQYDPLRHQLRSIREGLDDGEILATIQHQSWIGGGGFCVFVGAHWERYMWLYRHSRAYVNLLIQVGEFGQELVQAAYQRGLVGWMTPAVTEGRAATLFNLDAGARDLIYFLKFGPPRT